MATHLLVLLLFAALVSAAAPSAAAAEGGPILEYDRGDLLLERDRGFPPQADPGKIYREILLTGPGGGVYLMVWDLTRLHPAEWLERAIGPVTTGERTWDRAWLPGAEFTATVEVPASTRSRGMRVYAVRLGDVGVAALCHGVDDPDLSEACDKVAGSLEVRP